MSDMRKVCLRTTSVRIGNEGGNETQSGIILPLELLSAAVEVLVAAELEKVLVGPRFLAFLVQLGGVRRRQPKHGVNPSDVLWCGGMDGGERYGPFHSTPDVNHPRGQQGSGNVKIPWRPPGGGG